MQKINLMILGAGLMLLQACKSNEVVSPDFDVTTAKKTYKIGDTVLFQFAGNPNYLSFYSGEPGKVYENAARVSAKGVSKLQFTSARANGTQPNSLRLLYATNFPGITAGDTTATKTLLTGATWTDITSRANLSVGASTASGVIDLSDLAAAGKPVFLAFKYLGAAGSIQNKWTITNLTVTNTLPDASVYTIANLNTTVIANYGVSTVFPPGWVGYKILNNFSWAVTAGTSLVITGATTAATATNPSESWVIMGPVDLNRVAPDIGVSLKDQTTLVTSYPYVYKTAGTYNVTFRAANNNVYGLQEVIKQVQLTVTP
jgi:hypothetical protein